MNGAAAPQLGPLGEDVWYAIHYRKGSKQTTRFESKRVINKEAFLMRLREEHQEHGGVVEDFYNEETWREAQR